MVGLEIILATLPRNAAVIDGMRGTMVVTRQTTGALSVVQPHGRCTFYISHRTYTGTQTTLDAGLTIDGKLAVGYHPTVEKRTNHIGIEAGSGTTLQFDNSGLATLDGLGNTLHDSACLGNLLMLARWCVGQHERQANIGFGHDDRKQGGGMEALLP